MAASEAVVKDGMPLKVDYTPSGAQLGGEVIVLSDMIGVTDRDESSGVKSAIGISDGVYECTGDAVIAIWKWVWWDDTAKKVTETSGNNLLFGITVTACPGDGSKCRVFKVLAPPAVFGEIVDLNGVANALVFDADGDTTMSAPTDDQIDIEIGGADDFTFTANSFNVLTGSDIDLADSCQLKFGTGDDITMSWDGTDFDILQATVNSSFKWGVDGAGIDQVWYGDTAAQSLTWDQSADDLIMTSAVRVVGAGSTVVPVFPLAAQQTLAAGGGAITITEYYSEFASDAGGDALTLVDGAQVNQIKKIQMTTDGGGDGTLTPTNLNGGTTITFADVGDFVILMWDGTAWTAIELGNDADGTSAPVLA